MFCFVCERLGCVVMFRKVSLNISHEIVIKNIFGNDRTYIATVAFVFLHMLQF